MLTLFLLPGLTCHGSGCKAAMQVREGKVRGLDLHLDRLRRASRLMFGEGHDDADVCGFLRRAVECRPPTWQSLW